MNSRSSGRTAPGSKEDLTLLLNILFHCHFFTPNKLFPASCLLNLLSSCLLLRCPTQQWLVPIILSEFPEQNKGKQSERTLLNTGETLKLMCRKMAMCFHFRDKKFFNIDHLLCVDIKFYSRRKIGESCWRSRKKPHCPFQVFILKES